MLNAGNGWEWGNGIMINDYYGSFPHSLRLAPVRFSIASGKVCPRRVTPVVAVRADYDGDTLLSADVGGTGSRTDVSDDRSTGSGVAQT